MLPAEITQRKQALRREALARRSALTQPDADALSRTILEHCLALPDFRAAKTVFCYLDVRSEVRTRPALSALLAGGQHVVVPWCAAAGELRLFRLESLAELTPGKYGILEPPEDLRSTPAKVVAPAAVDFFLVPGVAFDPRGARLGHGQGYFDRLLCQRRPAAVLAGLAFSCQVFSEVPSAAHDVRMDLLITEQGAGRCRGA